jgi:MoaA/NifB/PqqE/SkfB family radical SAM enzyme
MEPAVRFTWNMLYDCNYRCSYCFFEGRWEEYRIRNIYLPVDKLVAHWARVCEKYGPIYLIITGGEPFIYPNFIEIIKKLSEICFHINISSNSSGDLQGFVEEIRPKNVSLSLSYHPQFDDLDTFIKRLLFIRKHQFNGCINLVAYPAFINQIKGYQEKFAVINEPLKVIPFFGEYLGKVYPQSYTPSEQEIIGINESWFKKVKRGGLMCQAGQKTALIFPDGKVARCGQVGEEFILGNLFDSQFSLLDKNLPCQAEYCPCGEDEVMPGENTQIKIEGREDKTAFKKELLTPSGMTEHLFCESEGIKKLSQEVDSIQKAESMPAEKTSEGLTASSGIQFTWDIHYRCNFRCPYCWFYEVWVEEGKRNIYLPVEEWMRHWRRIYNRYGKCHIAITGGEPFLYPNFIPLIKELSQVHSVKITTNMSGDIETFVKEIDPQKVILDLNFHPLFSSQEPFIKKTLLLKKAGFKAGVCYLAYPPQMPQISAAKKDFEREGINFALAAFWGEYLGRRYPESYSQQEREMIGPFLGGIDRINYHLKGESPKGKLCYAGNKYAVIQADGKVIRCGQLADKIIGDFFDEGFHLLDTPEPCEAETCSCNEYINLLDAKG